MKNRRKSLLALFISTAVMVTSVPVLAQEFVAEPEETMQQEVEEQSGETKIVDEQEIPEDFPCVLTEINVEDGIDLSNLSTSDQFTIGLSFKNIGDAGISEVSLGYEFGEKNSLGETIEKCFKMSVDNPWDARDVYEVPVNLNPYMEATEYTLKHIYVSRSGESVTYTYEDGELQATRSGNEEESWGFPYNGEADFTITSSEKEDEIPVMLESVSVKDGEKLNNLSTSEKFTAEVNIANVEDDEITSLSLVYNNDGHGYEYHSKEWYSGEASKPDSNGKVTSEVDVDLKPYSGTGKYNLDRVYIYTKNGTTRFYDYDKDSKMLSVEDYDLGRNHNLDYKGEADFTITKSEKENEISTMLESLSAKEGKNSPESDQFIVKAGFKNVEAEGIYEIDLIYDCNGERKTFQYFYSSAIKPDSKGELTKELTVNLPKTEKYKKYVLKEFWAFSENGDDRFYTYDDSKKALSVYDENLGRYHDFKYNGEIDLKQGADAVTNLKANSYGKNKVRVQWTKSTDADGYIVYGKRSSKGKYGYIGMTTKNNYYVDKNALDTDYNFYWVYPYKLNSEGKKIINTSCQYVYAKGVAQPVTNLKASGVKGGVKISWSKGTDAEGYIIYAARNNSKKFSYIGMTGKTSYTDTKASKSGYNYYRVYPYHTAKDGTRALGSSAAYVYAKAK